MPERTASPGARVVASAALAALLTTGRGGASAAEAEPAGEPSGRRARAVETVAAREAILGNQAAMARLTARWRARELYRFLRAGEGVAISGADRARVVQAGARALAREQHEERLLLAERDQARAEQAALGLPGPPDGAAVTAGETWVAAVAAPAPTPTPMRAGPAPRFLAPVRGARRSRFGAARDPATGAWFTRPGVRIQARAGEPVRAPAAGVVRRVATTSALGPALVIDHGGGWISVLANLDLDPASGPGASAARVIAPGARVRAGQVLARVGVAGGGLACELWRGQSPVDPTVYIHF